MTEDFDFFKTTFEIAVLFPASIICYFLVKILNTKFTDSKDVADRNVSMFFFGLGGIASLCIFMVVAFLITVLMEMKI